MPPFLNSENYDENRHNILKRRSPVDMIYLIPGFVSIEGKMQALSGALEILPNIFPTATSIVVELNQG